MRNGVALPDIVFNMDAAAHHDVMSFADVAKSVVARPEDMRVAMEAVKEGSGQTSSLLVAPIKKSGLVTNYRFRTLLPPKVSVSWGGVMDDPNAPEFTADALAVCCYGASAIGAAGNWEEPARQSWVADDTISPEMLSAAFSSLPLAGRFRRSEFAQRMVRRFDAIAQALGDRASAFRRPDPESDEQRNISAAVAIESVMEGCGEAVWFAAEKGMPFDPMWVTEGGCLERLLLSRGPSSALSLGFSASHVVNAAVYVHKRLGIQKKADFFALSEVADGLSEDDIVTLLSSVGSNLYPGADLGIAVLPRKTVEWWSEASEKVPGVSRLRRACMEMGAGFADAFSRLIGVSDSPIHPVRSVTSMCGMDEALASPGNESLRSAMRTLCELPEREALDAILSRRDAPALRGLLESVDSAQKILELPQYALWNIGLADLRHFLSASLRGMSLRPDGKKFKDSVAVFGELMAEHAEVAVRRYERFSSLMGEYASSSPKGKTTGKVRAEIASRVIDEVERSPSLRMIHEFTGSGAVQFKDWLLSPASSSLRAESVLPLAKAVADSMCPPSSDVPKLMDDLGIVPARFKKGESAMDVLDRLLSVLPEADFRSLLDYFADKKASGVHMDPILDKRMAVAEMTVAADMALSAGGGSQSAHPSSAV